MAEVDGILVENKQPVLTDSSNQQLESAYLERDALLEVNKTENIYFQEKFKCIRELSQWKTEPVDVNRYVGWKQLLVEANKAEIKVHISFCEDLKNMWGKHVQSSEDALGQEAVKRLYDEHLKDGISMSTKLGDVVKQSDTKFIRDAYELDNRHNSDLLQVKTAYNKEALRLKEIKPGKEWGQIEAKHLLERNMISSKHVEEATQLAQKHQNEKIVNVKDDQGVVQMPEKHRKEWTELFAQQHAIQSYTTDRQKTEQEALAAKIDKRGFFARVGVKIKHLFERDGSKRVFDRVKCQSSGCKRKC